MSNHTLVDKKQDYGMVVVEFKSGIDNTPKAKEGNFFAYIDGYCTEYKGIKYPMLQASKYHNTRIEAEVWLEVIELAYKS